MLFDWDDKDTEAVTTAKILAADAVERVGNGHPGTAISLAPVAYLLYQKIMRHDPSDVSWVGRDRFILSAGHSSLTQYVQLFLGGFGLELEDLKKLRTWGSKTPGHPEYGHTAGVEMTTGPLGQGLASAVGFSYASRFERGLFDPETPAGESPFDHNIFVIAGDGDLQEGITSEASSLAGHQKLGNLVVLYDSNQISIEDDTTVAFTEDVARRYEAYGWQVITVDWKQNGEYREDLPTLNRAFEDALSENTKPSLIILKTIIGWPSPKKQNTGKIHGSALGSEELAALKEKLGRNPEASFEVDEQILSHTRKLGERSAVERNKWDKDFENWAKAHPEKKQLLDRISAGKVPDGLAGALPVFEPGTSLSTRAASGKTINALAALLPELWGGSADLAESNNTTISDSASFLPPEYSTREWTGHQYGRVLHFGIREHAMGAILNGIHLHGNTRAFGGTFLVFSDYMRPALRLAALMKIPSTFVFTHDSLGLGEDGPTHQPVEHLASLRAIPGLVVIRPADANEVAASWCALLEQNTQAVCLALTRQNVPVLDRVSSPSELVSLVRRGAYILSESDAREPAVIIMASGSEVQLAVSAKTVLENEKNLAVRIVSVPSLDWFAEQDSTYQESIFPKNVKARVSIEAGISLPWHRYLGEHGRSVSVEDFGASADAETLFREYGITVDGVVSAALASFASHSEHK